MCGFGDDGFGSGFLFVVVDYVVEMVYDGVYGVELFGEGVEVGYEVFEVVFVGMG